MTEINRPKGEKTLFWCVLVRNKERLRFGAVKVAAKETQHNSVADLIKVIRGQGRKEEVAIKKEVETSA